MQEIQAIGGGTGGGRFFGGGDRRLRPQNHPSHQVLKCPRCDSLNTKFCYYNNYNLSQPRHFCKNCRRYWTKGGVLRNVPVGGGCRKTKRSKQKATDAPRERSSNAHQSSSSDSSTLTAATPTSATATVAEEGSAPSKTTSVYTFSDARFINGNPNFDHQQMVNQSTSENQMFTGDMGSFASLMASSADMVGLGMADIPTTSYGQVEQANQAQITDNSGVEIGGTATVEEFKMSTPALDWGSCGGGGGGEGDEGMFELRAAVDPAYWSQSQWSDNDQSLNF